MDLGSHAVLTGLGWAGLVDRERSAVPFLPVGSSDSCVGVSFVDEGDKAKASRLASVAVVHDGGIEDGAILAKELLHGFIVNRVSQASNKDLLDVSGCASWGRGWRRAANGNTQQNTKQNPTNQ